ncbi:MULTISPECIES: S24 family peptidase [unclassified Desulfovibrio]|uniref:LexA family transcriptional regulator n=1 Tax=unclassified Desulfovibrio TaxID=2593640 RepID=UPI0013ED3E6A|nr:MULTISPECIES: S24 family peptidase [unclassified Desulfovibrio]
MEDTTAKGILARLVEATEVPSEAALSGVLGVSSQAIYDARRRGKVPDSWIRIVAEKYNISADWLFFGARDVTNGPEAEEKSSSTPRDDVDLIRIPMVEARLSAGHGSLLVSGEVERSYAFRSDFLLRKGNPKSMVMMRVSGDSMQPEIMDNDVVLLDQSKTEIKAGRIFAVGFDDAIYCKRIDRVPGKIILKSVNPAYEPLEIDVRGQEADEFRVIGQVIWCGREYPI